MLALVLMVGIVIDDAIVVLENIFRFIEEKKMHPFEAAKAATAEIGLAVMATTFSLVVIFVPVSFMSSISGGSFTSSASQPRWRCWSVLLVSFTLTPMMSARLLRKAGAGSGRARPAPAGGFYGGSTRGYGGVALGNGHGAFSWPLWPCWSSPPRCRSTKWCGRNTCPATSTKASSTCGSPLLKAPACPPSTKSLRIEEELRSMSRRATGAGPRGRQRFSLGGVNSANFFIRLAPHESARSPGAPPAVAALGAFRATSPSATFQQEIRKRCASSPTARRRAQSADVRGRRTELRHRFRAAGPGPG
jgi:hydrophobic/amphiphilic exporter-1 (mainly G- bacteria), HAE1 family